MLGNLQGERLSAVQLRALCEEIVIEGRYFTGGGKMKWMQEELGDVTTE